jgi:hypothetical protein
VTAEELERREKEEAINVYHKMLRERPEDMGKWALHGANYSHLPYRGFYFDSGFNLTYKEALALEFYTEADGYKAINCLLRTNCTEVEVKPEEQKKAAGFLPDLIALFEHAPKLPADAIVHRGIAFKEDKKRPIFQRGSQIFEAAFSSTSGHLSVARDFATGEALKDKAYKQSIKEGLIISFKIEKGTAAIHPLGLQAAKITGIPSGARYPSLAAIYTENEFLLPPGAILEVEKPLNWYGTGGLEDVEKDWSTTKFVRVGARLKGFQSDWKTAVSKLPK